MLACMSFVLMFLTSLGLTRMSLVLVFFATFVVCISLVVPDFVHLVSESFQCIVEWFNDGGICIKMKDIVIILNLDLPDIGKMKK